MAECHYNVVKILEILVTLVENPASKLPILSVLAKSAAIFKGKNNISIFFKQMSRIKLLEYG